MTDSSCIRPENTNAMCDPRQVWKFLIINLVVALLVSFFLCPNCLASADGRVSFLRDYFIFSFLISMAFSFGIGRIVDTVDKRLPWIRRPISRLLVEIVLVSVYSFLVSAVLFAFFAHFVWEWEIAGTEFWNRILISTRLPIGVALVITLVLTSRSFLLRWKESAIETERMRAERLSGQYQSLKDQLNPHFLFNSLNTLGNLVYEDADRANAFIEHLASVYRYVLEVQDEELVSLGRELNFARDYLALHEIRFGSRMCFRIHGETNPVGHLPPLTLQLLIENVFKHNKATRESPLEIVISTSGKFLEVANTLRPRTDQVHSSGVGLNNIVERYKFLSDKHVSISESEGRFVVKVPLLELPKAKP